MLSRFRKSEVEPPQFNWRETPKGIEFTVPSDNLSPAEYAAKLPADAYRAQAQWLLLKEFLDNGQAESSDKGIHLPSEEVINLETIDQELLGLPEPYPFDIEIRSLGTLNLPDFRYVYQYLQPDRKPLHPKRIGCRPASDQGVGVSADKRTVCPFGGIGCIQYTRRELAKISRSNLLEFAKIKGLANQIRGSA